MFKTIPTIKPHSSTASAIQPDQRVEPEPADNRQRGKKVWMLRVADAEALEALTEFVADYAGITDLKPRYPYDAQKQREYRARKKAKDDALMQSVSEYEQEHDPDL